MNNLGHLMVDLETLGDRSNSVILAIGAVEFNLDTGQTGKEFFKVINIQSCLDKGLIVTGDTIKWWLNQDESVKKLFIENDVHISQALFEFSEFIDDLKPKDLKVWGNSNKFDLGILGDAYLKLGLKIPWKHTLERDVRTFVDKFELIKNNMVFEGIKHHPVYDCKHQIKYCSKIEQIKNNTQHWEFI